MASKFTITTERDEIVHHADGTETVNGRIWVPTHMAEGQVIPGSWVEADPQDCTCWMTSCNGCPRHYVR